MSEWIVSILLVAGSMFAVIGALGLVRMPDVLIRMHASTKIGTLACGLVIAGAAVFFGQPAVAVKSVLIVLFIMMTAPIASHMIGRAAISLGVPLREGPAAPALRWSEQQVKPDA